jgi:hypothetical protein
VIFAKLLNLLNKGDMNDSGTNPMKIGFLKNGFGIQDFIRSEVLD